jgi:DNA polymerase III delta prime subunit
MARVRPSGGGRLGTFIPGAAGGWTMSDADEPDGGGDGDEADVPAGREIWIEKYRPQTLGDIKGHEAIVERIESYLQQGELPHLLFSGPAGVGKCLTGDTPVVTDRGVERIEDVVGTATGFDAPREGLEVLTFDDDGEFAYVEPSDVFGTETDELVAIETRDGNRHTVTPEHRLLTVDHDGLDWVRADALEEGTRVARPRTAPLPGGDGRLEWVAEMDGDRTHVHVTESFAERHAIPVEERFVGVKKRVVAGLRRDESVPEIAAAAETTRAAVRSYRRELDEADVALAGPSRVCSLSFLRGLDVDRAELRDHVTAIQWVTPTNRRSDPITPPWNLTPDLATFVGLAVSEARLEASRVTFHDTDDRLLDRFESTAESVFGVTATRGEQNGVPFREVNNRTLTHLLESCFAAFEGAAGGDGIGSALVRADEESRRAFLRAVFDAEGRVTEGGIVELTQTNERLITLLSYLLAGEGVPSRRERTRTAASNGTDTERESHTLSVSSARHLARFQARIGFGIEGKAQRLAANAARESTPNDDTVPTQTAVDTLCTALHLDETDYVPETLDPTSPGRERYLACLEDLLDAATDRLETAQATLERLDRLQSDLDAVSAVPAAGGARREAPGSIETRRGLGDEVGVRSDRPVESADGRRTPGSDRAAGRLDRPDDDGDGRPTRPDLDRVRTVLDESIATLGVPDAHVAEGTDLRGPGLRRLLDGSDGSGSLARFEAVAERVRDVAAGMLSAEVVESLARLDRLVAGDLYFDAVTSVEPVAEPRRVYDLTVPGTRNYVAGGVPTVMHNTTAATAIARSVYGDDWRGNFLELNASDERGIDVVRDRIKSFARSSFGSYDYRIIFLDEADSLTDDAQSALRRTMEQFSDNTRFILSCNYSSRIIDPIQSRCAVFRFTSLSDEAIGAQVREIAATEDIEVTEDGLDALVYAAGGDMRRAINSLQAAATTGGVVDEAAVYQITSTARPEDIREMVEKAVAGDFVGARSKLETLLTEAGMAGDDVVDQLHRSVWDFGLDERTTVRLMERIGEADYRITAGANEQVQLEALLASLALDEQRD